MLEFCYIPVDSDPIDFTKDLSPKKSEMIIALITLVILGIKAV